MHSRKMMTFAGCKYSHKRIIEFDILYMSMMARLCARDTPKFNICFIFHENKSSDSVIRSSFCFEEG